MAGKGLVGGETYGSRCCSGSRWWRGCRTSVADRCHRRSGRGWSRSDRGRRSGGRHLVRFHHGSAGAQRYTSGRTAGLGAVPAGPAGRAEPGTAAVPADGHGVRADEGHRRRRHLGSRSTTCDGRVRVGERLRTRTRGGTAARHGRRPVAPRAMAGPADDRGGRRRAYRRAGGVRPRFRRRPGGRGHREHRAARSDPHAQHQRHSLHQRWRALRRKRRPCRGLCERRGAHAVRRTEPDTTGTGRGPGRPVRGPAQISGAQTWPARSRPCVSRAATSR